MGWSQHISLGKKKTGKRNLPLGLGGIVNPFLGLETKNVFETMIPMYLCIQKIYISYVTNNRWLVSPYLLLLEVHKPFREALRWLAHVSHPHHPSAKIPCSFDLQSASPQCSRPEKKYGKMLPSCGINITCSKKKLMLDDPGWCWYFQTNHKSNFNFDRLWPKKHAEVE